MRSFATILPSFDQKLGVSGSVSDGQHNDEPSKSISSISL